VSYIGEDNLICCCRINIHLREAYDDDEFDENLLFFAAVAAIADLQSLVIMASTK